MYTLTEFQSFLEKFKTTEYWQTMLNTVEDSPWHREANVAVHTEMVMKQYVDRFLEQHTEVENVIALTALLFHDVGKPTAEEEVTKDTGEVYRRYAGHEQDSAVAFQECYMKMPELREMLPTYGARAVRWIIEHHLPYGLKDKQKRQGLSIATKKALAEAGAGYDVFFSCLRSDAAGRISDNHEEKLQNVENWIAEFLTENTTPTALEDGQIMFILVGPSGSGKSTWVKERFNAETDAVISYDSYKLDFFKQSVSWLEPDKALIADEYLNDQVAFYDMAWEFANKHESEFNKFANAIIDKQFEHAKKTNGTVFVDVVNASKKKRAKFVELAKQKKFRVVAVEFWNSFQTLIDRQKTRGDKAVPYSSVKQQVYAVGGVWAGFEADEVWVRIGE